MHLFLRNRWGAGLSILVLLTILLGQAQAETPSSSYDFPDPPAPYVHPRVFVTAAELPDLEARLTTAGYEENITSWLKQKVNNRVNGGYLRDLADMTLDPAAITDQQIQDTFFSYGEFEMHDLAVMALWGRIFTDGEANYVAQAKETAVSAAHNYAIMAEHIHSRYMNDDYTGLTVQTEADIKAHWNQQGVYGFKPNHILRNGSMGLALAYDLLYDEFSVAEQDQIRQALIIGTEGWKIRGGNDTSAIGFDGNAVSNHYGYQGNQAVMLAAIYREAGFPQDDWDAMVRVIQNYLRVGFYDSGYPIEDSYGPDLGLREGGRALIALARQGVNEFELAPDKIRNIGHAVAQDIEAVPNGALIGGESGGNYAFSASSPSGENVNPTYPSFYLIWKHVYPNDPVIDAAYRWRVGDDYRRVLKSQSTIDYAFFGGNYSSTPATEPFNLMQYFPDRGKVIIRNDQSDQAVQVAFDARPDAFNIGHDKAGRGYFSLNGLGKRWVIHLNFRDVRYSDESSTMHVDTLGQAYKSPSVKMIEEPMDDGVLVTATADLAYAYIHQWNQPWTNSTTQSPSPDGNDPNWQHETIDPRTFFNTAPSWVGSTLWDDPNMGYNGMWMWRRPNMPMQKAYRTLAYLRVDQPFVIVADDIRQDDSTHLYESLLQLPFDLDQMSVSGNDAILWRMGENERLLVRILQADATSGTVGFTNEAYLTSVTGIDARRLRIGVTAVEPKLKVMLWPHMDGDPLPTTTWNGSMTELTVSGTDAETIVLGVDDTADYTQFSQVAPTAVILQATQTDSTPVLLAILGLVIGLGALTLTSRVAIER